MLIYVYNYNYNYTLYTILKKSKNGYAGTGKQVPLRMEWIKSLQVQILLPINKKVKLINITKKFKPI